MWTYNFFGLDIYHIVVGFCIYSVLGWVVESIYMSYCNKKLTNRGFGALPFCPIYGFGATAGFIVLRPLTDNPVLLYIAGAVGATIFEFIVAKLMRKLFDEVWWDYNMKPLNYQGIICLESTLAWGIYAIIVVRHLHTFVMHEVDKMPQMIMKRVCVVLLFAYLIDFTYHVYKAFTMTHEKEKKNRTVSY